MTAEHAHGIDAGGEVALVDLQPEPKYVHDDRWHFVEVDCEWGGFRFICEAPEGAPCRCLPSCQHAGGRCADYEGGHADACTDRTPVDTGECVIEPWIDNGEECGRGTARIPVATEWDDDWWLWKPRTDATVERHEHDCSLHTCWRDTPEVLALARVIYEAASDAADCSWDDLCALGSDALYRTQARAVLASNVLAATRASAADAVLAEARQLCCGENPSAHHAASAKHSERMAFAGDLARAVRGL